MPEEIAELSFGARVADPSAVLERPSGPTDENARVFAGAKVEAPNSLDPDLVRTLQVAMARVNRAQVLVSGLEIHATAAHDVATVNAAVGVGVTLTNRAPPLALEAKTWSTASNGLGALSPQHAVVATDSSWRDSIMVRDTVVSQPWWLRTPRRGDMFTQPVSRVAEDQRPGAAMVELALRPQAAGPAATFTAPTTVVRRFADPGRGEVDLPLAFVPAVTLTLDRTVEYVPAGAHIDRTLHVWVRSGMDSARAVKVSLQLPRGLTADSSTRSTTLDPYGDRRLDFRVRGTLPAGDATLAATAESQGVTYRIGYVPIDYEHIRPQRIYRPAEVHLSVVDVKVPPGLTVAYIPGVGDNVEPMLEQLGLQVTVLDPSAIAATNLSQFGTIVVGPRAFEASDVLKANNGRLLDFARRGGTLVVQYGQYEMANGILPYPITLARPADRVTDENAPVRILDPTATVLNTPNKIKPADFAGWVQERSSYMPHTFDSHYRTVMSMNDPDEPPNNAALLVAPIGKGTYVYATLAFFRQLPAGVPGPARLFANLLSLGKSSAGPVQ